MWLVIEQILEQNWSTMENGEVVGLRVVLVLQSWFKMLKDKYEKN